MVNFALQMAIKKRFSTQFNFAQRVQLCESAVSQIIRGRRDLDERDKKKWARLLDSTVDELFKSD